jgi:hypothetical protein
VEYCPNVQTPENSRNKVETFKKCPKEVNFTEFPMQLDHVEQDHESQNNEEQSDRKREVSSCNQCHKP